MAPWGVGSPSVGSMVRKTLNAADQQNLALPDEATTTMLAKRMVPQLVDLAPGPFLIQVGGEPVGPAARSGRWRRGGLTDLGHPSAVGANLLAGLDRVRLASRTVTTASSSSRAAAGTWWPDLCTHPSVDVQDLVFGKEEWP